MLRIFALAVCFAVSFADSSVILGMNNFSSFITGSPITLVMFYAPWCGHSKTFLPKYEQIANELSYQNIPAAKVDCVAEKDLYWENNIEGFPTIKVFFGDGSHVNPVMFKGERTVEDVIEFVKKQFLSSVLTPNLIQEDFSDFLSEFLKPVNPLLILYTPEGLEDPKQSAQRLEHVCKQMDQLRCALSTDAKLVDDMRVDPKVATFVMVRDFVDEASILSLPAPTTITKAHNQNVLSWAQQSAFPLFVEFKLDNEPMLFTDARPGYNTHVVLVVDASSPSFENIGISARDAARSSEFLGKLCFVYIDVSNDGGYVRHILRDLGLSKTDAPTAMIIKSMKTQVQFFRAEFSDLSYDHLFAWVSDFQANRLTASRVVEMAANNS